LGDLRPALRLAYDRCGLLIWFSRSDAVLVALISGATVQVIGLNRIVLRYIFPSCGGNGQNGSQETAPEGSQRPRIYGRCKLLMVEFGLRRRVAGRSSIGAD